VRRDHVWEQLELRGATIASVPFSGRAGQRGHVGTIVLSHLVGDELVDVERWTGRDELAFALTELLADGTIQPVIAQSFPFERAPDAHRFIAERRNVGKVVLVR
jgi:NADPH:quinone reductase-like Zn-dependent oxidoreductase